MRTGRSRATKGWLAVLVLLSGLAGAQTMPVLKPKMEDPVTHEELVERTRKAILEKKQPVFEPLKGKDPSVENRPGDLLSRSDILCFGGMATLVPKRAVLHVPKGMASRIGMQDGVKIVNWPEFIAANRAWITTSTVSRSQAEGNEPLAEATVKSFAKESRLVVAVYQECPISVLPPKVPETPATAAAP